MHLYACQFISRDLFVLDKGRKRKWKANYIDDENTIYETIQKQQKRRKGARGISEADIDETGIEIQSSMAHQGVCKWEVLLPIYNCSKQNNAIDFSKKSNGSKVQLEIRNQFPYSNIRFPCLSNELMISWLKSLIYGDKEAHTSKAT